MCYRDLGISFGARLCRTLFFLISDKTFIEKIEHHVHDGEHFEQRNKVVPDS